MQDYYISGGRKVADFSIGFLGSFLFNTLSIVGYYLIVALLAKTESAMLVNIAAQMSILGVFALYTCVIIINIVGIIFGFKKLRRFIAIGILSNLIFTFAVLPILLVGGCFVYIGVLSNMTYPQY